MTLYPQTKPKTQFLQSFLLGGAVSAFSKTLISPIETTTLHASILEESIITYLRQSLKDHGIFILWRRNLNRIKGSVPTQALNFAFYDLFKNTFDPKMDFGIFLFSHMIAGGAAGFLTLLITYPGGLSKLGKVQLAAEHEKRPMLTKDKILRRYKGFGIFAPGVMIYRSIYFGGYETAKKVVFPQWQQKSFMEKYLVALGVTSVAILLSNPVDVLRRKIMLNSVGAGSENLQYLDYAKRIYKQEGWKTLLKGSRFSWIPGIAASLNLVLFDEAKARLPLSSKMIL